MKNWMVMMNSIHDMNVVEGEEDESLDPNQFKSHSSGRGAGSGHVGAPVNTWPEVYKEPLHWRNLSVRADATMPFGRRVVERGVKKTDPSSAYLRYQLSTEILEKLKKPEGERDLDMSDPVVRVVSETIAPEVTADKPLSTGTEQQPFTPVKVLGDKDFVAFNPMVRRMNNLNI